MIVVLGRPSVYRPEPDGELTPGGPATDVARALARAGAAVELAGAVGDDPEGDRVVVELGRAGIGHAAVLRDPAGHTPALGSLSPDVGGGQGRALPRLEAADVELALGYLAECDVLVVAEPLQPDALAAALRAADYHGAAAVVVAAQGEVDPEALGERVTLLERPGPAMTDEPDDTGEPGGGGLVAALEPDGAFTGFLADYAMRLDRGEPPARAFAAALGDSDWESAAD